ncbi:hypothetical protein L9F63_007837, partial [Diploptera punctata]
AGDGTGCNPTLSKAAGVELDNSDSGEVFVIYLHIIIAIIVLISINLIGFLYF